MLSRTTITTIGSIVGVIAAGSAAVSANLGILTAADSTELGELSATSSVPDTGPDASTTTTTTGPAGFEIVDVYLDDVLPVSGTPVPAPGAGALPQGSSTAASSTYEAFAVDVAGEVTLENYGDRIEIERVTPAAGWSYTVSIVSSTELSVTFDGAATFVFNATLLTDGTIAASVEQPVVVTIPVPTPAPTPTAAPYDDDDDDDDRGGYDDDDDDDDDDDEDHEGGDDDD